MAKRQKKAKRLSRAKMRRLQVARNQEMSERLAPPVTYSQAEVDHKVKSAVERATHHDRVAGFIAGVAGLANPPPGAISLVNIGADTARAVAKELQARGFV